MVWLIGLTVLWAVGSLAIVVWYGAMMMDPAGLSLPDGLAAWVYGTGAVLVVYVAPLGLGWAAHARGAPLWVGLLYLVPHALSAAILGAVYRRGRR